MDWFEYLRRELRRIHRRNPLLAIIFCILALLVIVFLTPLIAEIALIGILILGLAMAIYWVVERWGFIK